GLPFPLGGLELTGAEIRAAERERYLRRGNEPGGPGSALPVQLADPALDPRDPEVSGVLSAEVVDHVTERADLVVALPFDSEPLTGVQVGERAHGLTTVREGANRAGVAPQTHVRLPKPVVRNGEQRVLGDRMRERRRRFVEVLGHQERLAFAVGAERFLMIE